MAGSIRHTRSARAPSNGASQRSASHGRTTSDDASQRTRVAAPRGTSTSEDVSQRSRVDAPSELDPPSHFEPSQQRGRKPGSQTKLRMPLRGAKVALDPNGDMQFSYVNFKPPYKYTTQLGVILKREYPSLVEDKDEDGVIIRKRPALEWADYFLKGNELGVTNGDRVISEFWRLFEVRGDERQKAEADRVLENYLKKRVKDMMYQARVDSVKVYYRNKRNQKLDDTLARPIELEFEEYMDGKLEWCSDEVWPYLCRYWCSKDFKVKRKRGQECRLMNEDVAQNRGGSRPFTETQQELEAKFGPEKATQINTYAVMKSGMKNVDSSGSSGPIRSHKAQKRMDDYIAGVRRVAHSAEEDGEEQEQVDGEEHEQEQEQELNPQVLYDVSHGTPHGRLAIANGAVRKADVRAAAKGRNIRPSNSMSSQSMAQENARLRRENAMLKRESRETARALQKSQVTTDLLLGLYRELGKEIPEEALQRLSAAEGMVTGSSHVGSESTDINTDDGVNEGEDLGGTNMENNHDSSNLQCGNHAAA